MQREHVEHRTSDVLCKEVKDSFCDGTEMRARESILGKRYGLETETCPCNSRSYDVGGSAFRH